MPDSFHDPSDDAPEFEWDPVKNEENIRKHGIDFADAVRVFRRRVLVVLDEREEYGEDRWIGIGLLDERAVVIVFSEPNSRTIRFISVRRATPYEQRRFYEQIPH